MLADPRQSAIGDLLHGVFGPADDRRDVSIGQLADETKPEDVALLVTERVQNLARGAKLVAADDLLLRPGLGIDERGRVLIAESLGGRCRRK
jgi:hypothetical protein